LGTKEKEANDKLKLMVQEQKEAEQKREESIKTSKKLEEKQEEIRKKQVEVQNDLGRAEPALLEAQESVKSISKDHLNELKAMGNPPAQVKYAIEAVVTLISNQAKKPDWNECKQYIKNDKFIQNVMNFDKDSVHPSVKKHIVNNYLNKKDEWDTQKIMRASRAAGPLAIWVQSLIEYADIFDKIQPLRNMVAELQESEIQMKEEYEKTCALIGELE